MGDKGNGRSIKFQNVTEGMSPKSTTRAITPNRPPVHEAPTPQDQEGGKTTSDLFMNCQSHLHVINWATEYQQVIKDEFRKFCKLQRAIAHKKNAQATRLSSTLLNSSRTSQSQQGAIGFSMEPTQMMQPLAAQLVEQAKGHAARADKIFKYCTAIQDVLDKYHVLMKIVHESELENHPMMPCLLQTPNGMDDKNTVIIPRRSPRKVIISGTPINTKRVVSNPQLYISPPPTFKPKEKKKHADARNSGTVISNFQQAIMSFERIRKPRLSLSNRVDFLTMQQKSIQGQLEEATNSMASLAQVENAKVKQWTTQSKLEDLRSRRDYLRKLKTVTETDLSKASEELKEFDCRHKNLLEQIIDTFASTKIKYEQLLKQSISFFKSMACVNSSTSDASSAGAALRSDGDSLQGRFNMKNSPIWEKFDEERMLNADKTETSVDYMTNLNQDHFPDLSLSPAGKDDSCEMGTSVDCMNDQDIPETELAAKSSSVDATSKHPTFFAAHDTKQPASPSHFPRYPQFSPPSVSNKDHQLTYDDSSILDTDLQSCDITGNKSPSSSKPYRGAKDIRLRNKGSPTMSRIAQFDEGLATIYMNSKPMCEDEEDSDRVAMNNSEEDKTNNHGATGMTRDCMVQSAGDAGDKDFADDILDESPSVVLIYSTRDNRSVYKTKCSSMSLDDIHAVKHLAKEFERKEKDEEDIKRYMDKYLMELDKTESQSLAEGDNHKQPIRSWPETIFPVKGILLDEKTSRPITITVSQESKRKFSLCTLRPFVDARISSGLHSCHSKYKVSSCRQESGTFDLNRIVYGGDMGFDKIDYLEEDPETESQESSYKETSDEFDVGMERRHGRFSHDFIRLEGLPKTKETSYMKFIEDTMTSNEDADDIAHNNFDCELMSSDSSEENSNLVEETNSALVGDENTDQAKEESYKLEENNLQCNSDMSTTKSNDFFPDDMFRSMKPDSKYFEATSKGYSEQNPMFESLCNIELHQQLASPNTLLKESATVQKHIDSIPCSNQSDYDSDSLSCTASLTISSSAYNCPIFPDNPKVNETKDVSCAQNYKSKSRLSHKSVRFNEKVEISYSTDPEDEGNEEDGDDDTFPLNNDINEENNDNSNKSNNSRSNNIIGLYARSPCLRSSLIYPMTKLNKRYSYFP